MNDLWCDWVAGDLRALRELLLMGAAPTDLVARIVAALDQHLDRGHDLGAMLAAGLGARRAGRRARGTYHTETDRVRSIRAAVVAVMERGWRGGRQRDEQAVVLLSKLGVALPHRVGTLAQLDYIKKTYSAHRREHIPGELRSVAMMLAGTIDDGPDPPRCAYEICTNGDTVRLLRTLWRETYDPEREAWHIITVGKPAGDGRVVELGGRRGNPAIIATR